MRARRWTLADRARAARERRGPKPFRCPACGKAFPSMESRGRHIDASAGYELANAGVVGKAHANLKARRGA